MVPLRNLCSTKHKPRRYRHQPPTQQALEPGGLVPIAGQSAHVSSTIQADCTQSNCDSATLPTGLTFLETNSILPGTLRSYRILLQRFMTWCTVNCSDWADAVALDSLLVLYFDQLYWHGAPSADGGKILAALKYFLPQYSRLGPLHLPRAHRALTSWVKLRPGHQRLPLPWLVLCSILGWLCHHKQFIVALNLLV